MVAHVALPVTASCPCTRSPALGVDGTCPLEDVQHRRGERLFAEGAPASHVWLLKRGCVVLTRTSPGGVEVAHAVRRSGAFLGLEALVCDTYRTSARVTASSLLGRARREVVEDWLAHGPSARMVLEAVLRSEGDDLPRAAASEGSAVERVARWVAAEATREGATQVPRGFAADLLGMTPETFSRALAQLARDGAIEVTRRTLVVRDPARLASLGAGCAGSAS
jgi:CRP-like cAMP-binding protein